MSTGTSGRSHSGGVLCLLEPRVFGDCLGDSWLRSIGRCKLGGVVCLMESDWLWDSWLLCSIERSIFGGVVGPQGLLVKFKADSRESFTCSGFCGVILRSYELLGDVFRTVVWNAKLKSNCDGKIVLNGGGM